MINEILERGLFPDWLVRHGVRNLLKQRLEEENRGSIEENHKHKMSLIGSLKQSPIAIHTQDANEQHYEVPTGFYQSVLGKRLKYSGGYWTQQTDSLDKSEDAMLELSCKRAKLENGHRVLDLGCGWGSVTFYVAENFPNCTITSVSNSKTQREYIETTAKQKGLTNINVITTDFNDFQTDTKFDRVISVEMLEHIKNYEKAFHKIASWLVNDGLFFAHIFTHIKFAYHFEVKDKTDWMAKYFFTGGMMPSDDLFLYFQKDLLLQEHWRVNGSHYQKTSEAWLSNMDKNKDVILPIFEKVYGKEAPKWWNYWRIFFMSCSELWGYNSGEEWLVSHYLFSKNIL
jgi:cyclopropane-fatty-acyl-phospholipid synthase